MSAVVKVIGIPKEEESTIIGTICACLINEDCLVENLSFEWHDNPLINVKIIGKKPIALANATACFEVPLNQGRGKSIELPNIPEIVEKGNWMRVLRTIAHALTGTEISINLGGTTQRLYVEP